MTTLSPPEAPVGLRERKKLATRRAIHESAFDLVERLGLSGTTIEAICEQAGVAPRTFWAYYASKEDAVIDRDPAWASALTAVLAGRPADEDPLTALRTVIEYHLDQRSADSHLGVRRQQLMRRDPQLMAAAAAAFDDVERALVAGLAERLGVDADEDIRPAVLVTAACGVCRVALRRWGDTGGVRPFADLVQEGFESLRTELAR